MYARDKKMVVTGRVQQMENLGRGVSLSSSSCLCRLLYTDIWHYQMLTHTKA